ncbi:MAG: YbhB/YbcL family Raf kinase inhibitor-like protein [Candidatus Hydrothermarchaeales archaeon]
MVDHPVVCFDLKTFIGFLIESETIDMGFTLTSEGFEDGGDIPARYTCDGEDVSPPLSWGDPPEGTVSLALIMDDPDAPFGTFSHWVLFNIPVGTRALPEGVSKDEVLSDGSVQGRTDFGDTGYGGPCPPPGKPHTYRFILYALDEDLDLGPGATREDVLRAIEGHVLDRADLEGRYGR